MSPRPILLILSLSFLLSGMSYCETLIQPLIQPKTDFLGGTQKAIAYSGFRHGQHPDRGDGAKLPSKEEILEDLNLLIAADFKLIRLYDSQQNSEDVLTVIRENKLPIGVLLGIWLKAELSNHEGCEWITEPKTEEELENNIASNLREIERGVHLANTFDDIVVAVNVGNESLVTWNDHLVSIESMIDHIHAVRSQIKQPISTADNYKVFSSYGPQLAEHLDFLAVHTYPQWEGKSSDEALAYSIENLLEIRAILPNKPIIISEAGWASTASEFGERANEHDQSQHYNELMQFCSRHNITVFWFEAFDEDWKGNSEDPFGAEKHWGIFNIDRTPKIVANEMLSQSVNP